MARAVILDFGSIRRAFKSSNFLNLVYNWNGSIHTFQIKKNSVINEYVRAVRGGVFFGFLEKKNYEKQTKRYADKKTVTNDDWRLGEFTDFDNLSSIEIGDTIEGKYPIYTDSGRCKQLYLFPYAGTIPDSFYENQFKNTNTPPDSCVNFEENTAPYTFYNQFKNTNFIDLATGEVSQELQLVGETASLLQKAGEQTAIAFQGFVIAGVGGQLFKFSETNGNFSRDDLTNYKRGLELWLKILDDYKEKLNQGIGENEKYFIYIDALYRYNMLPALTVEEKVKLLTVIANGKLYDWYFSFYNREIEFRESLAVKIIQSVNDNEAVDFLSKLNKVKIHGFGINNKTFSLHKALFYRLDDFFGADNFTAYAKEINKLVLIKHGLIQTSQPRPVITTQDLKDLVKYNFIYNKRSTEDFKGEIDYEIQYPSTTQIKVIEKICIEVIETNSLPTQTAGTFKKIVCNKQIITSTILEPFDLVSVSYLTNPSFLDLCEYADCTNEHFLASASYIDYLLEKKDTKFKTEIFIHSLQVLSLAFGVGELLVAIRTANLVRGIVGGYAIISDIIAAVISSDSYVETLKEMYPDNWEYYLKISNMISIASGVTSSGTSLLYSSYKIKEATDYIGFIESINNNPSLSLTMTTAEINALQVTRRQLLAELSVLRKNSSTNNLIENNIRTARDEANLHIDNARRGFTNESISASNTIKQHRLNVAEPENGNFGFLDFNNDRFENRIWRSGIATDNEPQIFTAQIVPEGSGWLRSTDSEYKMLNKFASYYHTGPAGDAVYSNVFGTLKIVSERAYCVSCQGIINQFNKMFPNIDVILIDNTRRFK